MSATIDERVVEMRFDNKQFESNVQTSMSTLEKLKKSLDLSGAAKGFENLDSAAKKCDMSGLSNAVETVKTRFSALEVMAITALANITNSVINTGKQILSSLTIEPISQGFQEYELKMGSIQTIMMSTGESLGTVNKYLNDLNAYSDKTIYSFSDMTSNIGKFTNAGVKLKDAVAAIKGVSNAAAVSGANTNEASRAMYNFAQALSAGYVKLIDWKSIENANMATVEFKTQLLEAAVAAGTVEKTAEGMYRVLTTNAKGEGMDGVIDATHNFNDSLSYQWMTTEALVQTLNNYATDVREMSKEEKAAYEDKLRSIGYTEEQIKAIEELGIKASDAATEIKTFTMLMDTLKEAVGSGWAQTWEIVFGDFEEAKKLWTEIGNIIGGFIDKQSDARNAVLQGWKDLGGRSAVIDAAKNAFRGLISVATPVKEAFREVFPPITAERLMNITKSLLDFTEKLKLSDTESANLKSTFKGLFAVLSIVKQAFLAIFTAISPLLGGLRTLSGGILVVTGRMGELLASIDEFIKKNNIFGKAINAFKDFAQTLKEKLHLPSLNEIETSLKDFIAMLKEKIQLPGLEFIHTMLERICDRMFKVGEMAGSMKTGLTNAIGAIGDALSKCKFLKLLQAIWNAATKVVSGITSALSGLLTSLIDKLSNADFNGIIDLLNSLALGGLALGVNGGLSGFFDNLVESVTGTLSKITNPIQQITGILDGVKDCLSSFQKDLQAKTLIKIAKAVAILAASIFVIALIDSNKLSASLGAITVMFADLIAAMAVFEKLGGVKSKGASSLVVFAAAVLVLSGAVKKLADLKPAEMAQGLIGVGVILAELDAFMATAKFSKGAMSTATGMIIMGAAIKILAGVVEDLAKLKWEDMARGLVGVGALLAEVNIFLNTAKFSGKAVLSATGMVIMAAAIKILASVCKEFADMDWSQMGKGLAAVGALLLEVAAFTKLTSNSKHVVSTGLALIEIAAAMKIFASAMKDFSTMSLEEIGRGLLAMGGALAEVTVALRFMPKNMVGIGTGLVIVGAALEIVANVLDKLGGKSWEEIGKGLLTLGVALGELCIALNLMTGTLAGSAALLVAATALAMLTPVLGILGAMSWEGIAKGLITLAGAFTIIGVAGAVLAPLVGTILALGGAFTLIGVGILTIGAGLLTAGLGLSALAVGFTALAAALTAGVTVIVAGIVKLIPAIGEAVKAVILTLVDVLAECIPTIADGILQVVDGVLKALVQYTPSIVDSIFQFLIGVLEGIAKNLPGLIQAAIDVLMSFFSGIVDALSGIDTGVLLKGIAGIGLLSAIMVALSAIASLVPGAMVGILGIGAVIAELALVLAAIGALAQLPGLSWLIGEGGKLLDGIGMAIGKFVGGIVGGFMSGVSSQFPQIGADLSAFMTNVQPFIEGASKIDASMMDGVKALAETIIILTAADILNGLTSWLTGGSSLSGFGEELVPFGHAMADFSQALTGMDANLVANAATAGKTLAEMASTIPNSGGVIGFFTGENNMKTFGEQLISFGEAMMGFANAVAGLDTNTVTEAAVAGKAMTEMAATIPNTGGVVGFFVGENDMKQFGEQLVPFGEAMMSFSLAVSGLKADAIVNSATAGKALIELANTVPNTGGAVEFFTGENDIDTFGAKIVPFGKAMKDYSDSVSGIDAEAITNSAIAGQALVELANTIPNIGGLVSFFTGDNDIGEFGKSLVPFGQGMKEYSDSVSGVNVQILSGVITEIRRLVDLARDMSGLDTSGMSGFSSALAALGKTGITGFINAFNNAAYQIQAAANQMLTTFINAANAQKTNLATTFTTLMQSVITGINAKQTGFQLEGSTLMIRFSEGIKIKDTEIQQLFTVMIDSYLTIIRNKYVEFMTAGTECMAKFIVGLKGKDADVSSVFTVLLSACVTILKNYYKDFYSVGSYLVDGFCNGISENTWKAEANAKAMAAAAARAAKKELDEHSPSKVGYRIGDFFGVAFVNAISDHVQNAYNASANMANAAKTGLSNAISKVKNFIDNDIDAQPTIRPVLDLTNVESGARKLNAMFSQTQALLVASQFNEGSGVDLQNGENNTISPTGSTITFTQNNYSPKALSRIEIYRQTKNQLSVMKEALA